jgi:hypothetical protein
LQIIRILIKEIVKLETRLHHIDIHQHWLGQEVEDGTIMIKWLPIAQMPVNDLIKALLAQKHVIFVLQLNLIDILNHNNHNNHSNNVDGEVITLENIHR